MPEPSPADPTPAVPGPLSRQDVLGVARLARLALSEEEVDRFTVQLGQILEYVERLRELDTGSVEPMAHAVASLDVLREDEPGESLERAEALSGAPRHDGSFFLVPPILDPSGD